MFKQITSRPNKGVLFNLFINSEILIRNCHNVASLGTIDKGEISRFKKLTDGWWNELGDLKALHAMNALRVPFIRDRIIIAESIKSEIAHSPKPLQNLSILDVGCGGGILSESLARLGGNVTGIDACVDLIKLARVHVKSDPEIRDKVSYESCSVEDYCSNCDKEKYDVVVASEIVEHVTSRDLFLKSCTGLLKPGGSIFLTTVNQTNLSWLAVIVASEYIFKIVPKGTHEWDKFVSPHVVQKTLEENNCSTKVVHGMFYNLLINKWHWIPSTSMCYAMHAVKKN